MKHSHWISAALSFCILAGCTATDHTSFRHQPLTKSKSSITAIDAKQRVIIAATTVKTTHNGGKPEVEQRFKFCAEPSPDVFSVVAQALSGGGTFGQTADPKAIEAALNMAFSSSEQGSTIPRTQTINMLRELMYRTCERWMNGELGDTEMPIQAARDQRLMVSILAIEQLTGVVTPKTVVIGSSSNASAGSSGADAAVRIDDAFKALTAKTAAQQARQKEFDELNTGTNSCDALAKKVEAKEALDDAQKQASDKCDTAKTALAQAKLERASAAGHHQSLIDASRAGGIPVSAESAAGSRWVDSETTRAQALASKEVALVVERIVNRNFDQDEFLLFCIKVLADDASDAAKTLQQDGPAKQACIDHIQSSIERETARNKSDAAALLRAQITYDEGVTSFADEFLLRVTNANGTLNRDDISKLASQADLSAENKTCLAEADSKAAFRTCFLSMVMGDQRILAGRSN